MDMLREETKEPAAYVENTTKQKRGRKRHFVNLQAHDYGLDRRMGDHSMANDSTIDALKNGRDVSMVAPVVMPDIRQGSVFEQDDRAYGNDFGQARS